MSPFIYTIAKFSSEILLSLALIFFIALTWYMSRLALKKRRLGVIQNNIPPELVKTYLNLLITDAHEIRTQLFGLKAHSDWTALSLRSLSPTNHTQNQPQEASSQSSSVPPEEWTKLQKEKAELESKLKIAEEKATQGSSSSDPELQQKLKTAEEKLAEYAIIEDDLANLKKLKKENEELRAALAGQSPSSPITPAEEPKKLEPPINQDQTPTPEPSQEPPAEPQPIVLAEQPKTEAKPENAEGNTEKKQASDDLLAEFEKMLNI